MSISVLFRSFLVVVPLLATLFPAEIQTITLTNGDVLHAAFTNEGATVRLDSALLGTLRVAPGAVANVGGPESNRAIGAEQAFAGSGLAGEGASAPVPGTGGAISINDFGVNSDNPDHRYLGKGFSELISFEVKKAPRLQLVDRDKRKDLLKEAALVESGLVENKDAGKLGKLLACDYIVFGSITDMGDDLLVSARLTRVSTSEVLWTQQLKAPGKNYPYISAYFAKGILTRLGLKVDASIDAALRDKKAMNATAVTRLSKGIDAYDRRDVEAAKRELAEARKLDPQNKVVESFLNRLSSGTAKFKVQPERYMSYGNPAYLGSAAKDRLFVSYAFKLPDGETLEDTTKPGNASRGVSIIVRDESAVTETFSLLKAGYQIPIVKGFGIGLEYTGSTYNDSYIANFHLDAATSALYGSLKEAAKSENRFQQGILNLGFDLGKHVGIGFGFILGNISSRYYWWDKYNSPLSTNGMPPQDFNAAFSTYAGLALGGQFGLLFKNADQTIFFDLLASYYGEKTPRYVPGPLREYSTSYATTVHTGKYFEDDMLPLLVPILLEENLTWNFNERKSFLIVKQMNEFYLSSPYFSVRLLPALEHWFTDWLSLRVGVEGALFKLGSTRFGYGGVGGLSLRLFKGFLELDANYTYRYRVAHTLDNAVYPESVLFFTLSGNGIFKR
ncbi:MAG: hypothetical protein J0L75_11230 [Spirochaetes bacterium]|nr:hypothetical protein [Spirochaetota bacterium]